MQERNVALHVYNFGRNSGGKCAERADAAQNWILKHDDADIVDAARFPCTDVKIGQLWIALDRNATGNRGKRRKRHVRECSIVRNDRVADVAIAWHGRQDRKTDGRQKCVVRELQWTAHVCSNWCDKWCRQHGVANDLDSSIDKSQRWEIHCCRVLISSYLYNIDGGQRWKIHDRQARVVCELQCIADCREYRDVYCCDIAVGNEESTSRCQHRETDIASDYEARKTDRVYDGLQRRINHRRHGSIAAHVK